jgi:hypothetical protein
MPGAEVVEQADPAVSAPPAALQLALWFPAFFVVLWFMVRLFGGRWIVDPDPDEPSVRRGGAGAPDARDPSGEP